MSTGAKTFFRSRWVECPDHVRELDPAELPAGFRAGGVAAGIKPSGGPDVGVIACDAPDPTSAALFTRNAVIAAPVQISKRAKLDSLSAVVVNAGNANVCDGERGLATAEAMVNAGASGLSLDAGRVAVASTGVIGQQLDRERVIEGIGRAIAELSDSGGVAFADAIVTTDRWSKRASLEVQLAAGAVRLCAQAKGGGMIRPDFATLLCFVETDARIDGDTIERLLRGAVQRSFDRISVDGQLSTNDSVFMIAGGGSGVAVEPGSEDDIRIAAALDALLLQLAIEIVSDGEGATRVAHLTVKGPEVTAETVARAVATSPLVQTALAGGDPNWGRILQAAGGALTEAESTALDLSIEGIALARRNDAVELDDLKRKQLEHAMAATEVEIEIGLTEPTDSAEIYFCDIGHDYITLNAEYTT